MTAWAQDFVTEWAAMSTTGGKVWDAARRLCTYMEAEAESLGLHHPGLNILELGAGVGHVSLCLGRNLPLVGCICATDMATDGAVEWLQQNVQLNHAVLGPAAAARLVVLPCDWREYGTARQSSSSKLGNATGMLEASQEDCSCQHDTGEQEVATSIDQPSSCHSEYATDCSDPALPQISLPAAEELSESEGLHLSLAGGSCGREGSDPSVSLLDSTQWDLVIGSDLVYNDVGCALLPHVLRRFAKPHTTILYAHTRHRFDNYDQMFFEGVAAVGLQCSEVREEGCETPPPSPPPLTELFPEMRIAVYRMVLAH